MPDEIKIQNHGFIPEPIKPEDYVQGDERLGAKFSFALEVLRPDGQWGDFLPVREIQRHGALETMNCTNYGTLNSMEILHKARYNEELNWSERYLGVMSKTTTNGNSSQYVAETIRTTAGCIPEAMLPFDDTITTWDKYYSPKPMTEQYTVVGQKWLRDYEFGHEYAFHAYDSIPTKQAKIMEALKYSPLGISVRAWQYRNGLYWKDPGTSDNHWCCLYGYEKGKHWKIYDSYDDTTKECEWNYDFLYSKRYHLKKITGENTMENKLVRKKGTKQVFLVLGGERYWIKSEQDFNQLKAAGLIGDWNTILEVDDYAETYNGKIIGDTNFVDILKVILGQVK